MAAELEMETLTEGTGEIAEVGKRVSVHYAVSYTHLTLPTRLMV